MKTSQLDSYRRLKSVSTPLWLVLFVAIIGQSLLPTLGMAISSSLAPGAYTTTVCTQAGLVTLSIGADGELIEQPLLDPSGTHCPYCVFGAGNSQPLIPSEYTLTLLATGSSESFSYTAEQFAPADPRQPYLVRAPPQNV